MLAACLAVIASVTGVADTTTVDLDALLATPVGARATVAAVRLDAGHVVDLDLERFAITTPATRFVRADGSRLDFDPDTVGLFRGTVAGRPDSHVFLALHASGSNGTVSVGAGSGAERFALVSRDAAGHRLAGDTLVAIAGPPAGGVMDGELCGVSDTAIAAAPMPREAREQALPPMTREIDLAVETDYDLYILFNDADATAAYVMQLYGAVGDIFARDVQTRIDLVFVRVWDDPDDLFNGENPLGEFREYWEDFMGDVPRDVAQFYSGRRDVPWGGVAYLDGLCNDNSYSVTGYALGFFADISRPHVYNRDVMVTAHELGHNCGTPHTHNMGLDTCDDEESAPRRGTIMSYCGQTFTGGTSNQDMRFHTVAQDRMREFMYFEAECITFDCNENGIDDADDLDAGTSDDANGNGIPDECEDCNDNGILDPADIAAGTSDDENDDGIPDECQPDCNANGIPDDVDLATISEDLNFNAVPDECEADCDDDGVLDYVQIVDDMSLDQNRNAILDACEDCDGDGTPDLDVIDHANAIYVVSLDRNHVREYLGLTGTLRTKGNPVLDEGHDVIIVDGRLLVASGNDSRVVEFDMDGQFTGDLVASGAGGLEHPTALLATPSNTLLVASHHQHKVLEYDLDTGAYLGDFVAAGAGGLVGPWGLLYDGDGDLLVTSQEGRVIRYDGSTGATIGDFVSLDDNGGLLSPRGLVFNPHDGNLLVCSHDTDQVLEYDGTTGAFIRQWNRGGVLDPPRLTLDQPWGIRVGPDGDIYVARAHDHDHASAPIGPVAGGDTGALHLTNARIYQFQASSGLLMRAYILGVNSGIEHPTAFAFAPSGADCNLNLVPDSCDIASGTSEDLNGNGVPDECEGPCNADVDGDGAVGVGDLLAVLAAWGPCPGCPEDIDGDDAVGVNDLLTVLAAWGPC